MAVVRNKVVGCGPGFAGSTACPPEETCAPKKGKCPVCGHLECLCRPRFFAGQLLTEADLKRLDSYIVAKNKLHNQHMHDWGTVCGLEVSCHPCGEQVVVSTGYAVDRCGNDIIVCEPDCVDVCALIDRCRRPEKLACRPYGDAGDCPDLEEEWILAIRYCERPSRGVTALRGSAKGKRTCASCGASACGGCGGCTSGNGGCNGGCDCNGSQTCTDGMWTSARRFPMRASPPECEPTVICESYTYEVFKKPKEDPRGERDPRQLGGPLSERFRCCLETLTALVPTPPGAFDQAQFQANPQAWHQWCCATKEALIEWYVAHGGYRCDAAMRLGLIICPDPTSSSFATEFAVMVAQLFEHVANIMFDCLCSALLPPCDGPTSDMLVPLASVTVRVRDCKVLRVCNWTPCRRVAITIPNLLYWLGSVPIFAAIRDLIHRLCCDRPRVTPPRPDDPATPGGTFTAHSASLSAVQAFGALLRDVADAPAFQMATLGANLLGHDVAGREQYLSDEGRVNPAHFLGLERIARPIADALQPQGDVRRELDELRGLVAEQAEEIAALRAAIER